MSDFFMSPSGVLTPLRKDTKSIQSFLDLSFIDTDYIFSSDKEGARRAYAASVLINRCITVKANIISNLPKRFLDSDNNELDSKSSVAQALGKRHSKLWREIAQDFNIFGYFILEPYQNRANRIRFKRLNPGTIEIIKNESGIVGFRQVIKGIETAKWNPEQLVYVWDYNPFDDLSPTSVIEYIIKNVETELELTDFIRSYFKNGGTPAGILTTDQLLRQSESNQYAREWKQNYGGGDNQNKVAVLGGGLKYQQLTPTIKDMVTDSIGHQNAKRICQIFGVPLSLALESNSSSANGVGALEQDRESLYRETIIPEFQFLADELSEQAIPFLSENDVFIEADIMKIDVLQNTRKVVTERATTSFKSGILTLNEARKMENNPTLVGGDVFFIGGRLIPREKLEDSEALNLILEGIPLNQSFEPNQTEPVNPDSEKQSFRLRDVKSFSKKDRDLILVDLRNWKKKVISRGNNVTFNSDYIPKSIQAFIRLDLSNGKDYKEIFDTYIESISKIDDDSLSILDDTDYFWNNFESNYNLLNNTFADTISELKKRIITNLRDGTYSDELYDEIEKELYIKLEPIVLSILQKEYIRNADDTKAFPNLSELIESAKEQTRKFTSDIIDTTKKVINNAIKVFSDNNLTDNDLANTIENNRESFDNVSTNMIRFMFSPKRISLAISNLVYMITNKALSFLSKYTSKKLVFRTSLDEKVCEICAPLEGVLGDSRGFKHPFTNEIVSPPLHPNCRCFSVINKEL